MEPGAPLTFLIISILSMSILSNYFSLLTNKIVNLVCVPLFCTYPRGPIFKEPIPTNLVVECDRYDDIHVNDPKWFCIGGNDLVWTCQWCNLKLLVLPLIPFTIVVYSLLIGLLYFKFLVLPPGITFLKR